MGTVGALCGYALDALPYSRQSPVFYSPSDSFPYSLGGPNRFLAQGLHGMVS